MLRPLQPPPPWAQRDARTPCCSLLSQATPKPHPRALHDAEAHRGGGEGRTPPPLRQGHPRPPPPPPPEPCPAPQPAHRFPGPRGPAPPSPGRLYRARGGGGELRFGVWICFRSNRAVVASRYLHTGLNLIVLLQRGLPWRGGGELRQRGKYSCQLALHTRWRRCFCNQ